MKPTRIAPTDDPIAAALRRAPRWQVEQIAARIGLPEHKVRGYGNHGTLRLAPWAAKEITAVLRLDDSVLDYHRRCCRRHDEHREAQSEWDDD